MNRFAFFVGPDFVVEFLLFCFFSQSHKHNYTVGLHFQILLTFPPINFTLFSLRFYISIAREV